jgi:hypothetical protein
MSVSGEVFSSDFNYMRFALEVNTNIRTFITEYGQDYSFSGKGGICFLKNHIILPGLAEAHLRLLSFSADLLILFFRSENACQP